jgi:transmembrane sensor
MNSTNNKPGPEVFGKYLAGEASPEEAMMMDEWLADPENRKEYEETLKVWNLLPGNREPEKPSLPLAWSEIQSTIKKEGSGGTWKLFYNRYAVAAVVTGLLVLGVLWFNQRTSQPTPSPTTVSEPIVKKTGDSIQNLSLPDGSTITLNKNSSIRYPNSFNQSTREIFLEGESYFSVQPDPNKPFLIMIEGLSIKVIGTMFNVRPLPATSQIEVQVQSGIVELSSTKGSIRIKKGQTGIYDKKDQALALKESIDLNSLGYATKSFSFNDLTLPEVCAYLENSFDVRIRVGQEKLGNCRITAQFDNKPLDYILDVISATLNTSYKKEGSTIYIHGEGCQ